MPKVQVDFSDTESRGGKKRATMRHFPPGDYAVKCTKAELVKSQEKETPGIRTTFKIMQGKFKGETIIDSLWLSEKALWRVRGTLEAMGVKVPSKSVNIDTKLFVGKECAVTLDDEEYDEKIRSRVVDTFSLSELDDSEEEDEEDVDEDVDEEEEETTTTDDDEDEEEEAPKKKAKAKSDDDEDDDLEDLNLDDL